MDQIAFRFSDLPWAHRVQCLGPKALPPPLSPASADAIRIVMAVGRSESHLIDVFSSWVRWEGPLLGLENSSRAGAGEGGSTGPWMGSARALHPGPFKGAPSGP